MYRSFEFSRHSSLRGSLLGPCLCVLWVTGCTPQGDVQRRRGPDVQGRDVERPGPPRAPAPEPGPPPVAPPEDTEQPDDDPTLPEAARRQGPVLTPPLLRLRAHAQARILGRGEEIEDADGQRGAAADPGRENGNELGRFVPVENEAALAPFHAALDQLQGGELPGGKLRVLAYGASHTQADIYTGYLRYYLQSRFGEGGPGFVQMVKLDKWYRHRDLDVQSQRFAVYHAQRHPSRASGWFGLMGAVGVAKVPGSTASVRLTRARPGGAEPIPAEIEVYSMGHPQGGELSLFVDGKRQFSWSTRVEPPEPLFQSLSLDGEFSEIQVRAMGKGEARLFGLSMEWKAPGVVVDTLGISGTRAANWLSWDEESWARQVQRRNPSLVLLAYGTNESTDVQQPIEHYARQLEEVLDRLKRAAPEASCLLVGPGDTAKQVDGTWIPRKRLTPIIEVQRRTAFEMGCGFWDTRAFMGPGGIARWARASPAMASADQIHLTRRGYVKLGMVLGDALLRGYDDPARPQSASAIRDR